MRPVELVSLAAWNAPFGDPPNQQKGPFPVAVTSRIIPCLVANPYKPLLATVTGKGPHPNPKPYKTIENPKLWVSESQPKFSKGIFVATDLCKFSCLNAAS